MAIDVKKASKEEIQRGLELLEKENIRKEKIKRGEIKGPRKWSELSDAEKDKLRAAEKLRRAKIKAKCTWFDQQVAAGNRAELTDAEIKAEMT